SAAASVNSRRSRAVNADADLFYQSLYLGLFAAREAYERTINILVGIDDVGHLGDMVSDKNGLQGKAALRNPQWVGAMMERSYHALRMYGAFMKVFQTMGLSQMIQ